MPSGLPYEQTMQVVQIVVLGGKNAQRCGKRDGINQDTRCQQFESLVYTCLGRYFPPKRIFLFQKIIELYESAFLCENFRPLQYFSFQRYGNLSLSVDFVLWKSKTKMSYFAAVNRIRVGFPMIQFNWIGALKNQRIYNVSIQVGAVFCGSDFPILFHH